MSFFELILKPFILIIKYIFLISYQLTGNYGWSIILLSFSVSALLLPVFIFIEKAKKKNDAIRHKMKPLEDEIKRCYKGQERYYYLKTLNRQHHFSPFKAMIPILSLLLQIPFFIAAYQFLEDYQPMAGVSFAFIHDLNAPDALFGKINFLPIAMTLVNLITAFFYTRFGSKKERNQMVVVAGIFLVLLFNLPSGLVLYWTMNNVFSFFRLFITNPEIFKKSKEKKRTINKIWKTIWRQVKSKSSPYIKAFIILTSFAVSGQVYWANNHSFDTLILRILYAVGVSLGISIFFIIIHLLIENYKNQILEFKVKPVIFFSLLFLSIYFFLSAQFYFTGVNTVLNYISVIAVTSTQLLGFLYFIKPDINKKQSWTFLISATFIFLLFTQLCNLIVYVSNGTTFSISLVNVHIQVRNSTLADIFKPGILFAFISSVYYLKHHKIKFIESNQSQWTIYLLSTIYIVGLIFLWNPLLVFSSSPATFDFAAIKLLKHNLPYFIKGTLFLTVLYALLPKKIKKVWLFILLLFGFIIFIYSSIIPFNLGSLQETRFDHQEKLAAPVYVYFAEGFFLILIFYVVKYLYTPKFKVYIITILILLNIFLTGNSVYKAYETGVFFKSLSELNDTDNEENHQHEIYFSHENNNIVFYIADGFQGWFMDKILQDDPGLKQTFEGFVWYPNSLSVTNYTHSSLPALLGGNDYNVDWMNKDTTHQIDEKITEVGEMFYKKIRAKGYYINSTHLHYSKINDKLLDNKIVEWQDDWKKWSADINLGTFKNIWYKRLYENAIFYSVPLFLKPKIYNKTEWLDYFKKSKTNKSSFKKYDFLRLLPYVSSANSKKPNFIFIHSHVTHNPWNIVTKNGEMINDVSPYENQKWFIEQFSNWVKWMKKNNVYDNTKIILVSDHGVSWPHFDGNVEAKYKQLFEDNSPKVIGKDAFWRLNPLMMVKDFNTHDELKEDWRLMSNGDVPSIIFDENNVTKRDSSSRTLETYWTFWKSHMTEQKTMYVHKQFTVTDNVFNLNNWKSVKK